MRRSIIMTVLTMLTINPYMAKADLEGVLTDDGWDEITFDDKSPNIFTAGDDAQGLKREVRVTSESSVSIAFLNVDIDLSETPKLSWSWLSTSPIIDTDTTVKGGDDRTLAIYIAFPYQPDQASFGGKLRRKTIELLRGPDTPDRVLTYMWGGGADRGAFVDHPYAGENGQYIYLRTPEDNAGTWHNETVNVKQDFIKAFGFEPVNPLYIGIGADSDDTKTKIKARVRNLSFMK